MDLKESEPRTRHFYDPTLFPWTPVHSPSWISLSLLLLLPVSYVDLSYVQDKDVSLFRSKTAPTSELDSGEGPPTKFLEN